MKTTPPTSIWTPPATHTRIQPHIRKLVCWIRPNGISNGPIMVATTSEKAPQRYDEVGDHQGYGAQDQDHRQVDDEHQHEAGAGLLGAPVDLALRELILVHPVRRRVGGVHAAAVRRHRLLVHRLGPRT